MADLIDRLSGEATDRPKINSHRFVGVERLYAFGEWTRQQIGAEFDLQGDEATQAGQIADNIDGKANASDKALYIARVEAVIYCIEDGNDGLYHTDGAVNKAKVYEDMQIAG